MLPASVPLLDGQTATGGDSLWPGGQGVFSVACGGFNGATIKLQFLLPDNNTWIDAGAATTLTANGAGIFNLHPVRIRCAIITAVPTQGVYAHADRIPV